MAYSKEHVAKEITDGLLSNQHKYNKEILARPKMLAWPLLVVILLESSIGQSTLIELADPFQPGLLAKEELIAFDWPIINASRQMSSFATVFMPNNSLSVDYPRLQEANNAI